jgi:hypothetical protein
MRNLSRALLCTATLVTASQSMADNNITNLNLLTQSQFKQFAEDLTAATSYKAIIPAEPLGITGFDVGAELSVVRLQHGDLWKTVSGSEVNNLPIPRLHAHKGLPLGIDVGVSYTAIPNSNIKLIGGELRYALIEGNMAVPAVAVRGSFSKLSGVDQLDLNSYGADISVSKGFTIFKPYGGVGVVRSNADPKVAGLAKESFTHNKVFAGLNINFGLPNLAFEIDKTGGTTSVSAKAGLRW